MKKFNINIYNKNFEIIQDDDGKFIIPNFVKDIDSIGTAMKPSHEPIIVARKPLECKSVAENVLKFGTGGINIDESKIGNKVMVNKGMSKKQPEGAGTFRDDNWIPKDICYVSVGRFPANSIFDEESGKELDEQAGIKASRFFYCPKSSKGERNKGLENREKEITTDGRNKPIDNAFLRGKTLRSNIHPTVKPVKLMEYLIRLVTHKGGVVLDPFLGSGTTGVACARLGFDFIGIEREKEYVEICESRINYAIEQKKELNKQKRLL